MKGKDLIYALVGAACVVYLFNPGWGMIELIPDNIPGIGNVDEVGVTIVLLKILQHFGVDLIANMNGRRKQAENVKVRMPEEDADSAHSAT